MLRSLLMLAVCVSCSFLIVGCIVSQATTQPTSAGGFKAMSNDEILARIVTISVTVTAVMLAIFRLVDLVIERVGKTRKLWRLWMTQQDQIQTLAQATTTLTAANKQRPDTVDVNVITEAKVQEIANAPAASIRADRGGGDGR